MAPGMPFDPSMMEAHQAQFMHMAQQMMAQMVPGGVPYPPPPMPGAQPPFQAQPPAPTPAT